MKTSGIEGPQLDASDDIEISDEELTLLAMAADPDAELGADAVPLRPEGGFPELLPSWYMPVPACDPSRRRPMSPSSLRCC